jgi:predicted secreted protein
MTVTSALVLFAVCWFMVFFIILPLRLTTQGDAGEVAPGTPPGAPAAEIVKRKARITTGLALVVWALLSAIILSGWITVDDFDWFDRYHPSDPAS